eukprot:10652211-Ditylum_brightwellii.AAC.1
MAETVSCRRDWASDTEWPAEDAEELAGKKEDGWRFWKRPTTAGHSHSGRDEIPWVSQMDQDPVEARKYPGSHQLYCYCV